MFLPGDPYASPEISAQVTAERQVKRLLVDPESATFRHVVPGRCGYVNARNRLGGMAGEVPFRIDGERAVLGEVC